MNWRRADQSRDAPWKSILRNADHEQATVALREELDGGRDINTATQREKTALHYAAKFSNILAASFLIQRGADMNAAAGCWQLGSRPEKIKVGWTPLHYAVRSDNANMVRLLLRHGAEAVQSKQKETPFEVAWIEYREEALWALVENGAIRHGGGNRLIGRRNLPTTAEQFPGCRFGFMPNKHLAATLDHLQRLLLGSSFHRMNNLDPILSLEQSELLRSNCSLPDDCSENPNSDSAFRLSASWLVRCLNTHLDCNGSNLTPSSLPSRVIDVGSTDGSRGPFLHESEEGEQGVYCTLSYRWPSKAVKTTQETLPLFKKCIVMPTLPQTIQDAIAIARKLGFRYIWIDALCIIQDSPSYWAKEAAHMHKIYRQSTLTIAALTASDSSPGIFVPRSSNKVNPDHANLHTRGWVLQEELLSHRILSYADGVMFWSCLRVIASDHEPKGVVQPDSIYRSEDNHRFRRILGGHRSGEQDWENQAYWLWRRAVTCYTMRDLTYLQDRLAAISGVGSVFGDHLNDILLAGVWECRLAEHLAWWVGFQRLHGRHLAYAGIENNQGRGKNSANIRHKSFKAPTWSWLSVTGPVSYGNLSKYGDEVGNNFSSERNTAGGFIDMTEIIKVDVKSEPTTADITGKLTLRGSLTRMFIRRHERHYRLYVTPGKPDWSHVPNENRPYSPSPVKDEDGVIRASENKWEPWFPDSQHPTSRFDPLRENEIFCFHLGNGGDIHTHLFQYCLCLVPTGKAVHEYERVGLCAWNPRHVDLRCPELQEKFQVFPGNRFQGIVCPNVATLETITVL